MAVLPFTVPEYDDPSSAYYRLMGRYESIFLNTTFIVIVVTILLTSLQAFLIERRKLVLPLEGQGEDVVALPTLVSRRP